MTRGEASDEGELYAMRLVQAGVAVEHRRFAGQMHGFVGMIDVLPGSAEGLSYIAGALDRYSFGFACEAADR